MGRSLPVRAMTVLRRQGFRAFAHRAWWWFRTRLRRPSRPPPNPSPYRFVEGELVRGPRSAEAASASVIVVVHNAPHDTIRCFESLVEAAVRCPFEIVIVDNGSERRLVDWLREFAATHEDVVLRTLNRNLGFARGVNLGASEAAGDVLVLLNSDTVVTDGWLDGLMEVLDDPHIGAVSPVTNSIG